MIAAKSSTKYIFEKTKAKSTVVEYPKNIFGKQLQTIAGFTNLGLETQVYYAGLSGLDTHANTQERLLKIYAESMEVFVNDLEKTMLLMMFQS